MQRHVGPQLPEDPLAFRAQLLVGIVLPRDEERGDLVPDVGLVLEVGKRVEHGGQARAGELHVELVGESLEVHVGRVHLRVELAPRHGRDVARGHGNREDARFAARVGGIHRVLREDHRVVVSEGDARASRLDRGARDRLRGSAIHQPIHVARFRDVPVLAELACEIAPRGAEREHGAAGKKMIERLLLDRIDAESRRSPIRRQHHGVAHARAHEARAALALVQAAIARAEVALDASVVEAVPPPSRMERALDGTRRAVVHLYFSTP